MKFTVAELAETAGGRVIGDGDGLVTGVAEADKAGPGDITYAVNRRYLDKLRERRPAAAIVPSGTGPLEETAVIEADNPYWSFARVLALFAPPVPPRTPPLSPSACISDKAKLGDGISVGPFSVIDDGAVIGDGTVIGPCCHVGCNVEIGRDCRLHHGVTIREYCSLGDRVIVHSGSKIGTDGYGFVFHEGRYHKIPQIGTVRIEDDVEIGSLVCIDRATIGETIIGKGCKLDNLVQIGHNVELGENCALVSQVGISGSTKVGAGCRFAGQSATSGHLTIGEGSTVAARGVVVRDLPAGSFVSGFPARPHKEERRILASLPRLPELLRRMAELERRVERLDGDGGGEGSGR